LLAYPLLGLAIILEETELTFCSKWKILANRDRVCWWLCVL